MTRKRPSTLGPPTVTFCTENKGTPTPAPRSMSCAPKAAGRQRKPWTSFSAESQLRAIGRDEAVSCARCPRVQIRAVFAGPTVLELVTLPTVVGDREALPSVNRFWTRGRGRSGKAGCSGGLSPMPRSFAQPSRIPPGEKCEAKILRDRLVRARPAAGLPQQRNSRQPNRSI